MAEKRPGEGSRASRARAACTSCRARKIRCNFDEQGIPCSNCVTDGITDCQTVKSLRGKLRNFSSSSKNLAKSTGTKSKLLQSMHTADLPDDVDTSPPGHSQVSLTHTTGWLDETQEFSEPYTTVLATPDHSLQYLADQIDTRFLHQELSYARLVGKEPINHPLPTAPTHPPSLVSQFRSSSPPSGSIDPSKPLPGFISELPSTLSPIELDYLRRRGAFDIPSTGFLKALLNAFVLFIHPYAPVIDLVTINRIFEGDRGCIGILPLQCIMFAALPYVDISYIQSIGFTSRRACRKAFYDRARVLYDNDVEPDKLATIQAVLLLSYWADMPGDNKGCWYWMGIAITLAQILGMHRKAEYRVGSPDCRLRKRVWWACYFRDRMLGIAIARPLRIRDVDIDTPPLTLEDFEVVDASRISDGLVLPSGEVQVGLAEMCIHQVELCKIGAQVLDLHFSMLPGETLSTSIPQQDNGATSAMVFPKNDIPSEQLVQQYDQKLHAWYKGLPPVCIYPALDDQRIRPPCLRVSAASLHVLFWSVVSALHRPQLRHKTSGVSIKRVVKAAIEVSRVNRELHQSRLDWYLPAAIGTCFQYTVFIIHAKRLAYRKAICEVTEVLEFLYYCVKVLETTREAFPGGDSGLGFMLSIARRCHLTLLFDQERKLWGIVYQGLQYSPGTQQLNSDSHTSIARLNLSSPGAGQPESLFHTAPWADDHPEPSQTIGEAEQPMDWELPSFEQMNTIDWSSLADFLPMNSPEYERSLGLPVDLGEFIQDVEMLGC